MKQEGLTYETALKRFIEGLCPVCGKKMEWRVRSNDYYCHKPRCKNSWNIAKLEALKAELPLLEPVRKPELVLAESGKGMGSFFKKLVRW